MSLYGIKTDAEVAEILHKSKVISDFHNGNVRRALRRQRKFVMPIPPLMERLQTYKIKKLERANRLARKRIAELKLQEQQKAKEERARQLRQHELNKMQRELNKWPLEKQRRCRINWREIVPEQTAKEQEQWERCHNMLYLRESTGATYRALGERFGVSHERARQIIAKADRQRKRRGLSPVERWMNEPATTSHDEAEALKQICGLPIAPARDWLYV